MCPKPGSRGAQVVMNGLGQHFESPRRPRDKGKTQVFVPVSLLNIKHRRLVARLCVLKSKLSKTLQDQEGTLHGEILDADIKIDNDGAYFDPMDPDYIPSDKEDSLASSHHMPMEEDFSIVSENPDEKKTSNHGKRPILPDPPAQRLYVSWKALIPTLVVSYQHYTSRTPPVPERTRNYFASFLIILRRLRSLDPRMAVSLDLLSFYHTLFEQFKVLGSLIRMVNQYTTLSVEHRVEAAIQTCRDHVKAAKLSSQCSEPSTPPRSLSLVLFTPQGIPQTPPTPYSSALAFATGTVASACASILAQCCPACFGGTLFGRSTQGLQGSDIHVATDGNFHHRHCRSAGNSPSFYDPEYFLLKQQVDAMGTHVAKQRKKPSRTHTSSIPDKAIDSCEASYEAADDKKQKTSMESFDDTGLMALICRHDIPLFFANVDTPGEQQKFALALIAHLFSFLPPHATVVIFYDIGCVLDWTLSLYNIFPDEIIQRLCFATTAMHAYGREWACQLVYNPRLMTGLGLSDGEGTERLWSRLIKLIGIECSSSRQHHIWLINCQLVAVGHEMWADLGDWIKRRLRRGVQDQGRSFAKKLLTVELDAPTRLKKELDTVLALQADIDVTDRAIHAARAVIQKGAISDDTTAALDSLEHTHDRLLTKVDALYASLNVCAKFPELEGIRLEFVRTLLLAHDLKINIRKCAIGSFFEWDKLN
ncbi:hypothetical protein JVU11DRAFT_10191 [Chiua virens]|nr:hypothetical protein JVU11DRAFT_10191 [Chiua virens]